MHKITVSRDELKAYYSGSKGDVKAGSWPKIEADLEPIIVLFSKIYIQYKVQLGGYKPTDR